MDTGGGGGMGHRYRRGRKTGVENRINRWKYGKLIRSSLITFISMVKHSVKLDIFGMLKHKRSFDNQAITKPLGSFAVLPLISLMWQTIYFTTMYISCDFC